MSRPCPRCLHKWFSGICVRCCCGFCCSSGPIFCTSIPVIVKLFLESATTEPPEAHIHHLGPAVDNCFVGNTCDSWVISLDWAFRLGPPHSNEGLSVGDHFPYHDKEGRKFIFGGQCHDKFDDLGYGENGTIKAWKRIILWEEDMIAFTQKNVVSRSIGNYLDQLNFVEINNKLYLLEEI